MGCLRGSVRSLSLSLLSSFCLSFLSLFSHSYSISPVPLVYMLYVQYLDFLPLFETNLSATLFIYLG